MSANQAPSQTRIALGKVTPVLRVRDTAASVDYYTRVLGFKINFQFPDPAPFFASVARGECNIFLSEGDQGNPGSWLWVDGKNVQALYEEFRASGAKIRHPPTNYSWALDAG